MILDWNAHCYKIHSTHMLKRDDPSDNKIVMSQEAHYVKYLLLRSRSYSEIYMFWSKIKNGTAAVFKDDPEQQVATFTKIFRASIDIPNKAFEKHYEPVKIYKSEIKFLNDVAAPVWVKQYWLVMLIYWKFMSQHAKNVEITKTLSNWAMRHTNVKDARFGLYQDKIAQYNRLKEGYVMQTDIYKRRNSRKYWFDWAVEKSDESFIEIKNLDNMKKALKLISGNVVHCSRCGKKFVVNPKQKTDLCPDCYQEERRQYNLLKNRELYAKKKSDNIEEK